MQETKTTKQTFFDSLKRGTGEAYLIARENPTIDFSKYIIKGALNNHAYDGQCESSRAHYIFDLISISNQEAKIRSAVLQGLATVRDDTWSLTHLFDLVKIFAQQGDTEARQALYDNFLHNPIPGSDWVGSSEILELDGWRGLLFIAEKYGKWLEQSPDEWLDDRLIWLFQENNPQLQVMQELNREAKKNRHIRIYLDNIKRTEAGAVNPKPVPQTFANIVAEVLHSTPSLSYRRTSKLTAIELETLAHHLITEKNKANQEKLLDIFDIHPFPLDSEFILNLARQKPSSGNRITEYATAALKHLHSETIRQFALERIPKARHPQKFINILCSNYQDGDAQLLTEIARKFKNEHMIEQLAVTYIDIYEANKTPECKEPLEVLYAKMTCGLHRNSLLRILIENKALSERIREEIPFDCDLETRELLKN
ncbi:hypothetical protein [Rufibacter psychrotolerans]|uniref:hypothetical protein n=1 Tax=Rufibacter psychrotolerans TaxID=2812556 RepID=UPI0019675BEC|nr:hypothetical protein [Rufibacter sp. SYSU D00308]